MKNIDEATATELISRCVEGNVSGFERITDGQIASTFGFEADGVKYILQFNQPNMATSYRKERYFADRFRKAGIPVREVVGSGEYAGQIYTVARRVEGTSLSNLEPGLFEEALPSVFDVLLALETIDIEETSGFGWYDEDGNGPHDTWLGHLSFVADEEPGMYYGHWHTLFDTTFLERDRYERYFEKMITLATGLHAPRRLVHSAFGYHNVLVHNGTVSVVLDWQDSLFGDHLKDITYMDFWPSGFDLLRLYRTHCTERGVEHEEFDRRIAINKLYQGLDSMRYFAKVDNKAAYDAVVGITEKVYWES